MCALDKLFELGLPVKHTSTEHSVQLFSRDFEDFYGFNTIIIGSSYNRGVTDLLAID